MSHVEAEIAGLPVRVFRVSFSGELAYEVATPAGYGEAVWSAINEAGSAHGLVPYGTDALGSLRIEKGHVAAAEINGHTTASDLGLQGMMNRNGDFIGRVNAMRPGLVDPERPRLVGIRAVDPAFENRLRAGAHIVDAKGSTQSLGWVSSVTRSATLDCWIGLALIRHGPEQIGKRLFATFPLKGETVGVEITSPHHVDPENKRVRA
jgi:sarcosine oxidase subunit alpha